MIYILLEYHNTMHPQSAWPSAKIMGEDAGRQHNMITTTKLCRVKTEHYEESLARLRRNKRERAFREGLSYLRVKRLYLVTTEDGEAVVMHMLLPQCSLAASRTT